MSRRISNTASKPFCKVCFETGKPESEYSNHWVKNNEGVVICPTLLLNTECKYCRNVGHTVKFCPTLGKINREKEKKERIAKYESEMQKTTAPMQSSTKKSKYSVLFEDEDEPSVKADPIAKAVPIAKTEWLNAVKKCIPEPKPTPKPIPEPEEEQFPALTFGIQKTHNVTTGWTDIVRQPFVKSSPKLVRLTETKPTPTKKPLTVNPLEREYKQKIYIGSWADCPDSDSEDEY